MRDGAGLSRGKPYDTARSHMTGSCRHFGPVAALLALCLPTATAAAKTISITITPTAEIRSGALTVRLSISNLGDEAAHSVTPTLHFRDREARGKGVPSLVPNASLQETLTLPAADLTSGRWPYRVSVDYTDANQYPFQALQVLALAVENPPPAKVAASETKTTTIATSGSLSVKLKNLARVGRTAVVAVVVP